MAASMPVTATRAVLVTVVVGLVGFFVWSAAQQDPEGEAEQERVVFPQPAYTPGAAEPTGAATAQADATPAAAQTGATSPTGSPSPLPDHLKGNDPIPLDGVIGSYTAAPQPVRALVRLTDEIGYLPNTPADFRIKHGVITCERVAFQSWTWDQQVDGDVANGVAQQTAQEFADLLEREFCSALGL